MSISGLFPAGEWGYGLYGEEETPCRAKEDTVNVQGAEYFKYTIEFFVGGEFKKANTSLSSFLKNTKSISKEEFNNLIL